MRQGSVELPKLTVRGGAMIGIGNSVPASPGTSTIRQSLDGVEEKVWFVCLCVCCFF